MANRPVFTFQKLLDRGTATPCVARTLLQASDLINAFFIPEEQKQRILEISHDVMLHQCACLDVLEEIEAAVKGGIATIEAGIDSQGGGATLPSVTNLRKRVEGFLLSAKQSLRDTGGLFEVFHEESFEHRFDKAGQWAAETLGDEAPLTRLLAQDSEWIKRLIDWRNAVEHPGDSRGPLEIQDFRMVGALDDGEPLIMAPTIWRGEEAPLPLLEYMETTQDNLLTFFEDLLACLLLALQHPLGPRIVEIPEEDRDPAKPVRLTVRFTKVPHPKRDSEDN